METCFIPLSDKEKELTAQELMDSFNKQLDTDGYLYKIKITGIVKNEAGAVIEISSGDGGLSGEPTD